MGNTFVALANSAGKACTTDSDCYAAFTSSYTTKAIATTDAEKKLRCCQKTIMGKPPSGTNKSVGDASLASWKLYSGVSIAKEGDYNLSCNFDYPAYFTTLTGMTETTWDSAKNTLEYNDANG